MGMETVKPGGCPTKPLLVGVSAAIRGVVEIVDTVAESDCCVLIEGESGTGKELVARRLHAMSPRRGKPFIPVNCAGVSETLFESQFFGHVRGAFTGAEQSMLGLVRSAEGGTLFMDEVGEIPLNIQPKFLRVLQDGEVMPVGTSSPVPVDTRFIAATNRDLRADVRERHFREDLYYRLNVVRICLPALRERPEDISVLLDHFLAQCTKRYKRPAIHVGVDVRRQLARYTWPGNVRELANWVERLYATGLEPRILTASLLDEAKESQIGGFDHLMSLEEAEHYAVVNALRSTHNNRTAAARILGINRATLLRKITQYQTV
ncbi:MAG: sigma 54-interacting transcriptional regulator [Phycisphaerae bacterium]|nr:sigma 54-interacting transcriptional regulator [Phycisphaerae bacterium]